MREQGFAEALRALDDAVDGFAACDAAFRVVYVNAAAERLSGKSKAEFLGKTPWESSANWGGLELELASRRVAADGIPAVLEHRQGQPSAPLEVCVLPGAGGGVNIWFRPVNRSQPEGEPGLPAAPEAARLGSEIDSLYRDVPVGLALVDRGMRYLRINQRLARINGPTVAEHLGRTVREALPELAPTLEPLFQGVLDTGVPAVDIEIHGTTGAQPGVRRDWLASFHPHRHGAAVEGVLVVVEEITGRRESERALREKTDELEETQRLAGVCGWTWDPCGGTLVWPAEAGPTEPAQARGRAGFQALETLHTPESWRRLRDAAELACRDGKPFEVEVEAILPDGRRSWRMVRGEAQRDAAGQVVRLRGTNQDIDERKRAEEKLRMAHAELAAIHAHAPMVILVVDEDLCVRKVNEAARQFAGRPETDMLGLRPGAALGCLNARKDPRGCGFAPACVLCNLRLSVLDSIRNQARHDNLEAWLPVCLPEGNEDRCFLLFTAPLQLPGVGQALVCAVDITSRKRAEKALRDSEYRLNESQRISRVGSYVLDCASGNWTSSPTLDEIFGIGPGYPRTVAGWQDLVHPDERVEMLAHLADEVLRQGKLFDREYRIVRSSDGKVRWVHGRGAIVCDSPGVPSVMTGTIQDITSRRTVEEELRQSHKLEGLGRLAGGIAHDFNNLLTVINGYGDMLFDELREGDPLRESVAEIRKAGQRATELTRQLLTFSRKQIVEPRPLDLNGLIREHLDMLQRLVGEDIEVEARLVTPLGRVVADPGQMHQVLLNLVVNARDAMPRGGRLTIATCNRQVEEGAPAGHPGMAPGAYVQLAVSDTGVGIDAEVREHIFDPFFTTKDKGAGTGLGLSTVYGIVQQAGGTIAFHSESGLGTTFVIHLPCSEAEADDQLEARRLPPDLRGSETILVVEDQESVRKLAVRMLSQCGYRILTAPGGEEAVALSESYPEAIHLLLTDVVMPRMTGRELAEALLPSRPAMKVLYMSGYAEDAIASRGLLDTGLWYIAKPFTAESLARKVREVLVPPAGAGPARILVVDDESGVRNLFQKVLADAGYGVQVASDGDQALAMVRAEHFDLVLTDLVMPEREGIEVIQSMRREHPELKIIAVSGAFGGAFLKVAQRLGAHSTLAKPVSPEQLLAAVRGALG